LYEGKSTDRVMIYVLETTIKTSTIVILVSQSRMPIDL